MSLRDVKRDSVSSSSVVEAVIEKKLDEIVTILDSGKGENGNLYDDVLSMIERSLIKIAMRRSNNVKTTAASFLGINRNTLHSKINKLEITYK
jgi:DNA-binding protein Fis